MTVLPFIHAAAVAVTASLAADLVSYVSIALRRASLSSLHVLDYIARILGASLVVLISLRYHRQRDGFSQEFAFVQLFGRGMQV